MKKVFIFIVIIEVLFIIAFITYKIMYKKNMQEIVIVQNEIEVFNDVFLHDVIDGINIIDDYKIDTDVVGLKELDVKYKNKMFTYKDKIKINIIDKDSPLVLSKNVTVVQGNDVDLVNSMICADNYDSRPNCYIDGDYNINEVGTYSLKYVAIDSSNNRTEKDFKLNVIEPVIDTKSDPVEESFTLFSDIVNIHKNDNTRIGIDVSKWQGNIDFESVKNSGCEFVIIKAGGSYVDGELYTDPYFITNIEGALKNGLDVGVYFYSHANSIQKVEGEISYLLDLIKDYDIKIGIAFDWENFSKFNSYNVSLHSLNMIASTFLDEVKNKGYRPMLYSSKYYLQNIWDLSYDTWVAQYASKNTYDGDYVMWQLCDDGKIDGILGYVDIDVMYKITNN